MASTGNIRLGTAIITGDNNLSITNPYSVNSRLLSFYTFNSSDLSGGTTMKNQADLTYDLTLDAGVTINNNTLDISSTLTTIGATITDTLNLSGLSSLNTIGVTIGGWFYSYTNNSNRKSYIFSLSDNSNSEISMYLEIDNTLNICIKNYTTSLSTPDTSYVQVVATTININTWYYFSWIIRYQYWYFYLNQNGNSYPNNNFDTNSISSLKTKNTIGKFIYNSNSINNWYGKIDNFYIYNGTLTDYQILDIYNKGQNPTPSNYYYTIPIQYIYSNVNMGNINASNLDIDSTGSITLGSMTLAGNENTFIFTKNDIPRITNKSFVVDTSLSNFYTFAPEDILENTVKNEGVNNIYDLTFNSTTATTSISNESLYIKMPKPINGTDVGGAQITSTINYNTAINSGFSVGCFFNLTDNSTNSIDSTIFSFNRTTGTYIKIQISKSRVPTLYLKPIGSTETTINTNFYTGNNSRITIGVTYHICWVVLKTSDTSSTWFLYMNGRNILSVGNIPGQKYLTNGYNFNSNYLGRDLSTNTAGFTDFFNGYIDNFFFYNGVLSAAQVNDIYNYQVPGNTKSSFYNTIPIQLTYTVDYQYPLLTINDSGDIDTSGDFYGNNASISGNITLGTGIITGDTSGNIIIGNLIVSGITKFGNISMGNANIGNISMTTSGNITLGNIVISGNGNIVDSSGNILIGSANIINTANIGNISMTTSGLITIGNVLISGNGNIVDSSGNILIGSSNIINTANIGNISMTKSGLITIGNVLISGNGNIVDSSGNILIGSANIINTANIGNISMTTSGLITIGNVLISGNGNIVDSSGNILIGSANIINTANIGNISMTKSGTITLGSMVLSGNGNITGNITNATNVYITSEGSSTTNDCFIPFIKTNVSGFKDLFQDNDADPLSYNPSTGQLSAKSFSGIVTLAEIATNADNVVIANINTASTFYPVFVSDIDDYQPLNIDTSSNHLSYVPSTGNLTATTFIGNVTIQPTNNQETFYPVFVSNIGSQTLKIDPVFNPLTYNPFTSTLTASNFNGVATNATNATNANTIYITNNDTTNGTYIIPFVKSNSSAYQPIYIDNVQLTYNPSTATLTTINANISRTANIGNISMQTTGNITLGTGIITGDTLGNIIIGNLRVSGNANIGNISMSSSSNIRIGAVNISGNGDISGTINNVTITDTSSSTVHYPVFVSSTGSQSLKVDMSSNPFPLSYIPSTGTLTTEFFNGKASEAEIAFNADKLDIINDNTNTDCYIPFSKTNSNVYKELFQDNTIGNLTYNPSTATLTSKNLTVNDNVTLGSGSLDTITILGTTTIGNPASVSSGNIITIYGNVTFANIAYHNQINEKIVSTTIDSGNIIMDYNQSSVLYLTNDTARGNSNLLITNIPSVSDNNRSYIFTIVGNHYGGIITNLYLNGTESANRKPIYFNGGNATVTGSFPQTTFTNYYANTITVQQIGLLGNVSSATNANVALSSVSFFTA